MGAIATAVTIATYALFGNNQGVFWAIFSLSSVVFLLPYVLMFPSLVVLRNKFPDQPRPYTVPGGKVGPWLSVDALRGRYGAHAHRLLLASPPEGTCRRRCSGCFTGGGTIVSLLIGWWLYWQASHRGGGAAVPASDA